ncbi:MAG: thermonuclease family protein [Candidatus Saccharibacteria bacterium]
MARRLRRKHKISIIGVLLVIFIAIGQQQGWFSSAAKGVMTTQPGLYSIDHYVDGDTIAVNMNGTVETIRFIGIDTPETHKPNTPVQCYGSAAAAHTQAMIKAAGGKVRLVSDSLSTNRDRYNRPPALCLSAGRHRPE